MKSIVTLFVLISLLFGTVFGRDSKIYYGQNATEGQFPFMVRLYNASVDFHFCGGSLIGPQYVLTAAHCVEFIDFPLHVRGGSLNVKKDEGEVVKVKHIWYHPEFNKTNLLNDVAVLKLATPFSTETNMRTIRVATKFKPSGTWYKVAGWGQTDSGFAADNLLYTRLQKIKPRDCRKAALAYKNSFDPALQICTENPPHSACYGDSGGPLFFGSRASATQHGIVSGGVECGGPPSLYAKVMHYYDWIVEQTNHSMCVDTANYYENWKNLKKMCMQMNGTSEKMAEEGRFCCHNLDVIKIRDINHSWSGCNSTSPVAEFCWKVGRYTCMDDMGYCKTL